MRRPSSRIRRIVTGLLLSLGSTGAALLDVGRAVAEPITSATVTITAQNVNRLVGDNSGWRATTYNDLFDVGPGPRLTLTWTSATTFHNALQAQIPGYSITDVKLVVRGITASTSARFINTSNGGWTNLYSQSGTSATSQSWDNFWGATFRTPAPATTGSSSAGWQAAAGTVYSSTAVGTRSVSGTTTTFTFSPSLVQNWISTPSSNQGLLFTSGTTNLQTTAATSNVQWQITIVPEPAALGMAIVGAGCFGITSWMRRRVRAGRTPGQGLG